MTIFELTIGGITIAPTYYALMYILGFIAAGFFLHKHFRFHSKEHFDDIIFWIGLGVIIGGRLGYVLLYSPQYYFSNPLEIFAVWKGGMSFHGGLLGVLVAMLLFAKSRKYDFWYIMDHLAVIAPVGLGFGRIGNYLNNELYGYAGYTGPFGMKVGQNIHFPSPLLEMLLEGIVLFAIMGFLFYKKGYICFPKRLSGIFLIGYGLSRIAVELVRLPDANIGYLFGSNFITLGMLYSLPMFIIGIFLILSSKNTKV